MIKNAIYILFAIFAIALCPNTFAQPKIEQGKTQTWYGRVNRWTLSRSTLKQELDLMQECGVSGYMIELASWGRYSEQPWCEEWIKMVKKEYHHIVRECRKRDLWLFVSIVNDNMGKGKYGDPGISLESVYDYALELAEIVKKAKSHNIIIQPVAETNTEAGERFEAHCKEYLKEFTLVYNGSWGYPKHCPAGFDFRAVHPSHIVSAVPTDALVISDHGIIIRELSSDGGLESKGDPEKVKQWVDRLTMQGVPVVGYYAFKYKEFDPATILSLGKKRQ